MHTIYTLSYPSGTLSAGIVFFVGYDEDWEQEAKTFLSGRLSSHTTRVIRYLWRNKKQPVYIVELQTDDSIQAQQRYEQLLTQHASPKLTNRVKKGV